MVQYDTCTFLPSVGTNVPSTEGTFVPSYLHTLRPISTWYDMISYGLGLGNQPLRDPFHKLVFELRSVYVDVGHARLAGCGSLSVVGWFVGYYEGT